MQMRQARLCSMGGMVASIAHEVNQPLAAVSLNAQAALRCLEREQPSPEQARVALRAVLEATARAEALLRSIRNLSQNISSTPELCRVDAAVQALLPLLRGELERHRIVLRLHLSAAPHSVLADPVQLQQVLLNLVGNAIEAMREVQLRPRELIISSRADGAGQMQIVVADSGPGLPPHCARQIFEPLFTTKPNGMGMGLAICRSIVEAHGGSIWAADGMLHGSVFGFSLAHEPQRARCLLAPARPQSAAAPHAGAAGGCRHAECALD